MTMQWFSAIRGEFERFEVPSSGRSFLLLKTRLLSILKRGVVRQQCEADPKNYLRLARHVDVRQIVLPEHQPEVVDVPAVFFH